MLPELAQKILNHLLGPNPRARDLAIDLLRGDPKKLAAFRPYLDTRLSDDPTDRYAPAKAIRELYGDSGPLIRVVVDALRSPLPDEDVRLEVLEIATLGVPQLLVECAFARTTLFSVMFEHSPRWVTRLLLSLGRPGILTLRLFLAELPDYELRQVAMTIADETMTSPHDLSPLILPLRAVRLRPYSREEVGLALWRLTWQIDREWIDYLVSDRQSATSSLAEVLLEVFVVCPDVELRMPAIFLASTLTVERERVKAAVRRMFDLGPRGVKLLLTLDPHDDQRYSTFRLAALSIAAESIHWAKAFLPLAERELGKAKQAVLTDQVASIQAACRVIAVAGNYSTNWSTLTSRLIHLADVQMSWFEDLRAALRTVATKHSQAVSEQLLNQLDTLSPKIFTNSVDRKDQDQFERLCWLLRDVDPNVFPRILNGNLRNSVFVHRLWQTPAFQHLPATFDLNTVPVLLARLTAKNPSERKSAVTFLFVAFRPTLAKWWPWLVAALAVPLQNREVIVRFQELREFREAVAAELLALQADRNPIIATNATEALHVLNAD